MVLLITKHYTFAHLTPFKAEPVESNVMSKPPRPLKSKIIDRDTAWIILIQSLIIAIPSFLLYIFTNELQIAEPQELIQRRTLSFVCLTTLQMTQSFLSRSVLDSSLKVGILGNKFLLWAFILSMSLMLIGVYVPGKLTSG